MGNFPDAAKPFRRPGLVARGEPLFLRDETASEDRVADLLLCLEREPEEPLDMLPLAVRCLSGPCAILMVLVGGGRHWLTMDEARLASRMILDEPLAYDAPYAWAGDLIIGALAAEAHAANCEIDHRLGRVVGWGERQGFRLFDGGLA